MAIVGVSHFGLCVTNLEAALNFYCGILGFEKLQTLATSSPRVARLLEFGELSMSLTFIEREGTRLELIHFDSPSALGGGKGPFNRVGYTHLSLKVLDFDAELERLRNAGVTVLEDTNEREPASNARFAFVLDPDGNRVELFGAIDESARKPWEIAGDAQPPAALLPFDEVLTTTRTVRRRLDLERPVPRELVEHCLRIAFQAPNGQNQQTWNWILVDDPATRRAVADLYRAGLDDHMRRDTRGEIRVDETSAAFTRMRDSVAHLVEVLQDVPVILVPTLEPTYPLINTFGAASAWGSILPAVWSFMLALRSRGLGSAWTTLHLYREREMAELLEFPHDHLQVGLFPVAYTLGTSFRPADRADSESRIFWNRWSARAPA